MQHCLVSLGTFRRIRPTAAVLWLNHFSFDKGFPSMHSPAIGMRPGHAKHGQRNPLLGLLRMRLLPHYPLVQESLTGGERVP
jgi:hypothetical protein